MDRPRPWKLWHLSALVGFAALVMAWVLKGARKSPLYWWMWMYCTVGLAFGLVPFLLVEKFAGRMSDRVVERGRARGGPAGLALMALGRLIYFAIALGTAG